MSRRKPTIRPPRRWRALLLLVCLAGACAGMLYILWQPVSTSGRAVRVVIPRGTRAEAVAGILEEAGIIRNRHAFLLLAALRGEMSGMRSGAYVLRPNMPSWRVLELLQRGARDPDEVSVSIPEGFTVKQIAARLAEQGVIAGEKEFLALCARPAGRVRTLFPLPASGLEGYLFPDTYAFRRGTSPERVAQVMLDRFEQVFYTPRLAALRAHRHTLHELVTIASMIEREARVDSERARIAGVIQNRLRRGMKLQIDATVLYALGAHKSRVLYADLEVDSPYNTYRHAGLPPGPIASPGIACLEAAMRPEKHDYLYYVATPEGAHIFTRTEREHNQAVARMRALRAAAGAGRGG